MATTFEFRSESTVRTSEISVVSTTQRTARRESISRDDFLALVQSWTPQPKIFISPGANVMELHQTFLDLYMPRVGSRAGINSIFSAAPSSCALSSAIKSVCLLLVYQQSNDPRLFHAAGPEYSRALRSSSEELCRSDKRISTVVGTAHMLSLYELFTAITIHEISVGTLHSHWLTTYVESCRTDNSDSQMQLILVSAVRMFATWGCLLARKGVRGFYPRLQRLHEGSMDDIIIALGDLAIATSGAAETSDKLCLQSDAPTWRILTLLNETIWLEGELHQCLTRYHTEAPCRTLYWTASVNEKCLREVSSAFRHVYEFVDLQTAADHLSYWMSLLVLTESRISILQTFFRQIVDKIDSYSSDLSRLRRCSNAYADSLCMSIRFTSKPENGWAGRMLSVRALSLLVSHFKKRCDWQKLSWCIQIAAEFNIRTSWTSSQQATPCLPAASLDRVK